MNFIRVRWTDQFPAARSICRPVNTPQRAGNPDVRIGRRDTERANGLSAHLRLTGPVHATVVGDVETAIRLVDRIGAHNNMFRVAWVDNNAIQDQIVAFADQGKTFPAATRVMRLIQPAVRGAEIQMHMVLRIGCEPPGIASVRPERQPRNRKG